MSMSTNSLQNESVGSIGAVDSEACTVGSGASLKLQGDMNDMLTQAVTTAKKKIEEVVTHNAYNKIESLLYELHAINQELQIRVHIHNKKHGESIAEDTG